MLWQVASLDTSSGATINQGQASKGKLYFDVTGAEPIAVIYDDGGPKPVMMWCCNGDMKMPMDMPIGDRPGCARMKS